MRVLDKKKAASNAKWTNKLGNFLGKLYPVAKLSLSLTSAISEVPPDLRVTDSQGANFLPLKGAANGLAIILQVSIYR